jgi:hypothetical protein
MASSTAWKAPPNRAEFADTRQWVVVTTERPCALIAPPQEAELKVIVQPLAATVAFAAMIAPPIAA